MTTKSRETTKWEATKSRLECTYKFVRNMWCKTFAFFFRLTKEYQDCEIIPLAKKYSHYYFTFGVQKHSPYMRIFNYYLKLMKEDGTLDRITRGKMI